MAQIQHNAVELSPTTPADSPTGRAKLEQLKALKSPPETKPERVARALGALRQAKRVSNLDPATIKYLAQHADLEGD